MKRLVASGLAAVFASSVVFGSAAQAGVKDHNNGPAPKGVHTMATGISGWAVVDSDGTLARKLNAKSVEVVGVGERRVLFNSNIRKCAYVASVGLSGSSGTSGPGYVTVVGAATDAKGVYITTFDETGALADQPFHLIVQC